MEGHRLCERARPRHGPLRPVGTNEFIAVRADSALAPVERVAFSLLRGVVHPMELLNAVALGHVQMEEGCRHLARRVRTLLRGLRLQPRGRV